MYWQTYKKFTLTSSMINMKQLYLLLLSACCLVKGYSQNCNFIGCALTAAGSYSVDVSPPDATADVGSCYTGLPYKQVYWMYFYTNTGGDYTQSFTPTNPGDPLDLDYIVFDIGITGPGAVSSCPVNSTAFTEILCNLDNTSGIATGPGIDGTVTTLANHFYAIAIYAYQAADAYTFDIGVPQLDGTDMDGSNCTVILPVKLNSFKATFNNCKVNLDWEAQNESNFKHYEVEYSSEGRNYSTIGIINPSSNAVKKYSFQHPAANQGTCYYRLKLADLDGNSTYSKVIAMNINCGQSSVLVYPNPVTDLLNVNVTNAGADRKKAMLFNINGKLLYSSTLSNGSNEINMHAVPKGIYILKLQDNTSMQQFKIIK